MTRSNRKSEVLSLGQQMLIVRARTLCRSPAAVNDSCLNMFFETLHCKRLRMSAAEVVQDVLVKCYYTGRSLNDLGIIMNSLEK